MDKDCHQEDVSHPSTPKPTACSRSSIIKSFLLVVPCRLACCFGLGRLSSLFTRPTRHRRDSIKRALRIALQRAPVDSLSCPLGQVLRRVPELGRRSNCRESTLAARQRTREAVRGFTRLLAQWMLHRATSEVADALLQRLHIVVVGSRELVDLVFGHVG